MLIFSISWGCTLVLGTGNWVQKNGSTKPPIILVLIFAVSSSLLILPLPISDPVCFPCGCRCRVPSQQAACSTSLFPGLLPGTLSGSLPVPPGRCSARPRVPDWKMDVTWHGVGCRNLLSRFECCSLRYRVHVCAQTRWLKSGCDYRVEVLFCTVVHIDCCLLAASRASSFFNSYCYLRLEKTNWYHFKSKHRTDALQLCHDPRAGFGLSHLYTSMFQDWLFQDLLKYCSAAQVAELGHYFSFLMKRNCYYLFPSENLAEGQFVWWWWWYSFKCTSANFFNRGNGVKQPISLLNDFNNFW